MAYRNDNRDNYQGNRNGQERNRGRNSEHYERNDPTELESKTVLIQNKRFYLDVKENNRGRFLKIAEVTPGGHKNRVTMSLQLLPEFRNLLSEFVDHYASLGPSTMEGQGDQEEDPAARRPLKSVKMVKGQRRYFMDLKENSRGRYLRVRAPGQSNEIPQQQIVLPASGMVEFRDAITGLIEQFEIRDEHVEEQDEDLPESAAIGNRRSKMFYMDVAKNHRGIYVRMTEQSQNYRQSITIPDRQFRAIGEWFIRAADQIEGHEQVENEEEEEPVNAAAENSRRRSRDDDEYDSDE